MDSQACTEILNRLQEDSVSRVVLVGEAGIGKTWVAREICDRAVSEKSCYSALWLNLNKDLNEKSLYEDIASQLSLFHDNEEDDIDDDGIEDGNSEDDEEEHKTQDFMGLKGKILRKLTEQKLNRQENMYFLLVLDDEGSVTNEEKVMKDLYLQIFLASYEPLKILLTRRKEEEEDVGIVKPLVTDESPALPATDGSLGSHTLDASQILCETFTEKHLVVILLKSLIKNGLLDSLEKAWGIDVGVLKHRIVGMSMRLPAAVVVLAKSLNCITPPLSTKQEEVFKIAVLSSFPPDFGRATFGTSRRNPILHLAFELLKTDDTVKSSIVECFWHSLSFFEHCGCVHYQELIAHWILEGYFDPVKSVAKAYKDGHDILMGLMNRGILKIQEDNVVMAEVAMKNLIDLRHRGLSGRSRIGLAKVCGSDMINGLGKINQVDDTMEAVRATRKGETITTILVSGNRLRRETPEKFFENLKDLEILGLFELTLYHVVPSIVKLVKLRVLVIRNCDLLKDIEELKALQRLHVLEVSGASSLKEISDDFFTAIPHLQSLHLSRLQITYSPSSISKLKGLHCLIIRDCPVLEDLPDIHELVNLEVVDISGACGLQTCFDKEKGEKKNKSKNRNFCKLTKLQLLDFSESQIERLPMFQDSAEGRPLHTVSRLLLRNCSKLIKLPSLKPLAGLQILDLSGTTSLVKMLDVCFEEKKELRILNLSGTNLSGLATTIQELSNLQELLLRNCTNLKVIPNITRLQNLEVFDVSGCTKLDTIEGSFENMHYLREVNLSGTKMKTPELPTRSRLCCPKRIILADGTCFEGKDWDEVEAYMPSEGSEEASTSGALAKSQDISEKESAENEPRTTDCTKKGDGSKERLRQVPMERTLYKTTLEYFKLASQQQVIEINETNEIDREALANAEFVSFVDCSPRRLTSVFNETRSVKGCWLWMCTDVKDLFCDVAKESLELLETLSITNLPLLETISCGGSFTNLKRLSLKCCPNIKTLFPEASQVPTSLKDLNVKYCEKLEKVAEGVKLSAYTSPKGEENFVDWAVPA